MLNPLGAGAVTVDVDQPVDRVTVRKLRGVMSATAAASGADAGTPLGCWWSGSLAAREFWMAISRRTQATLWQLKGKDG